jgi:GntR family transcriptional regulator of arabinose operon
MSLFDEFTTPPAGSPAGAKHLRLEMFIESLVRSGRLAPNEKLPSENELCEMLSLSRTTIRKAIDALERKSIVYRRQGQGTFAAESAASQAPVVSAGATITVRGVTAFPPTRKEKGLVGLLVPSMENEIYPLIVRGVEDVADAHGWSVFIGNTYADLERESALIGQMVERQVDGLIIEPTQALLDKPGTRNFQRLLDWGKPCVLIDNDIPGLSYSRVMIDDFAGGRAAAEYLISKGHTRVAYLYKESVLAGADRLNGFIAGLEAAGVKMDPSLVIAYSESDEALVPGYLYTTQLLRRSDRPTAIFYFNDELALHGVRAIRDLGLRYPADVSIIGFDNVKSAASPDINLTSIEHPKYFAGKWAADILFDQIESGSSIRRRVNFLPEIVERGSVGAPPRL